MAEHHFNDFGDDQKKSSEEKKTEVQEENSDIIELSDIAIGTTPEDDVIVELTEEVIDEAMVGISGATRDSFKEGEEYLDLSKVEPDSDAPFKDVDPIEKKFIEVTGVDMAADDVEDHITKELDDFFGSEEEPSAPIEKSIQQPVTQIQSEVQTTDMAISQSNLLEALETVIKKMYGETINKLLAEAIEKTVIEEINRIKEFLADKIQK
jgi:hypothetical protein